MVELLVAESSHALDPAGITAPFTPSPLPTPADRYALVDSVVLAGGQIVELDSLGQSGSSAVHALFFSEYASDGTLLRRQIVSQNSSFDGVLAQPLLLGLQSGGFLIGWDDGYLSPGGGGDQDSYAIHDPSGAVVATARLDSAAHDYNLAGHAIPLGGFQLTWLPTGQQGQPMGGPHWLTVGGPTADQSGPLPPVYAYAQSGSAYLELLGGQARYTNGATVELASLPNGANPSSERTAVLADGRYAVVWADAAGAHLSLFDPASGAFGAVTDLAAGASEPRVLSLADGGFAVSWRSGAGVQGEVIDASGARGPTQSLAGDLAGVDASGRLLTAGRDSAGSEVVTAYGAGPAELGAGPLQTAGDAITLSGSAGWTSAAQLANGQLTLGMAVDGGWGSHVGQTATYDPTTASETASASLLGYAPPGETLSPEVASLGLGGFYEVTYPGSTDYEIYNANDQRVFVHNAYTSPTAAFAPLSGGGYVVTDSAANVFGLFDASGNNVGWLPYDSHSGQTPTEVRGLLGGGFVMIYGNSSQADVYDATGHIHGVSLTDGGMSDLTQGFADMPHGGFARAWLTTAGGQYGLPTQIMFAAYNSNGATVPGSIFDYKVKIAQDLDPWHTTFSLQAHADGSVAILWSEGGGIYGAEFDTNGQVAGFNPAMAGDLSTTQVIELTQDRTGMAWLQNGDVWAQIFDAGTGAVTRADLGAADGDLSTVHLLALADGGAAISWHEGGAVVASILGLDGRASAPAPIAGDFVGVDPAGHALTLHSDIAAQAVLQAYQASDSLFWVH